MQPCAKQKLEALSTNYPKNWASHNRAIRKSGIIFDLDTLQ